MLMQHNSSYFLTISVLLYDPILLYLLQVTDSELRGADMILSPSDVIFRCGPKVRPIINLYVKTITLVLVPALQFGHTPTAVTHLGLS